MSSLTEHKSSLSLDVTSPFDGTIIESVPMKTAADVELMLQMAKAAFQDRDHWFEPYERVAILSRLAELVKNETDQFAMLIASEGGKPLVDAKVEVERAIEGIYLAEKQLATIMCGKEIPMGYTKASVARKAFTIYEPIGVVVAISAFNHPLNLIIHQVIPAIAVGCPIIVKPASATPLNCIKLIELVHRAGLPAKWCQVCVCDNQVAEKLATDNRISFLSFIGSARVGWGLKQKLAAGVRCALEHGGVAPVILDNGINIDKVIPPLIKGSFYHAGQVCVSVQRIYAPSAMAKKFAKKLAAATTKLIVGDPKKSETEVGPLIWPREVTRIEAWVNDAIEGGAKLMTGGKKLSETLYAPTVLLNPSEDAKVSTHEIFGPVVCVYSYQERLDAIERANNLDFAFQASIFTDNIDTAFDTIKRLDATTVMINDHTAFRVDWMPFGGRRQSGYSTGGIEYTMHDMLQPKMAIFKLG